MFGIPKNGHCLFSTTFLLSTHLTNSSQICLKMGNLFENMMNEAEQHDNCLTFPIKPVAPVMKIVFPVKNLLTGLLLSIISAYSGGNLKFQNI